MNETLLILGMAIVTFGVRYPILALIGKIPLPDSVVKALRYVPPAILSAIVVPGLLYPPGGKIGLSLSNAHLVAGLIAVLVAWRSRNLLWTILIGMGSLWLWRWVLGIPSLPLIP